MRRLSLVVLLIYITQASCSRLNAEDITTPIPTATRPSVEALTLLPGVDGDRISIAPPSGLLFIQECGPECGHKLWIIDHNGEQRQFPFDGEDLAISSDQRFVSYQKDLDIWLLNLSSRDERQITSTPDCWEHSPAWSPNNRRLMFFGCGNGQLDDIYIFDLETEETRNLTNTPEIQEACIDRSPGECIIEWQEPSFMIVGARKKEELQNNGLLPSQCHTINGRCPYFASIVFIDNGKYQVLDQNSGIISPPAISPDKRTLAYDGGHLYDLIDKTTITLIPSNYGSSPLLATIPIHSDGPELIHPVWSPDGR